MYLSGLPILILNRMHPRLGRWSPFAGLLTSCLALALGSFSTTVPHLIVTQGILYAIGGSIAYIPCMDLSVVTLTQPLITIANTISFYPQASSSSTSGS